MFYQKICNGYDTSLIKAHNLETIKTINEKMFKSKENRLKANKESL